MADRQPYLGPRAKQSGRKPYLGEKAKPAVKKKKHKAGFLSRLGSDLYHAAVNTPAGVYYAGKAVGGDVGALITPRAVSARGQVQASKHRYQTPVLAKETVRATASDIRHPLRHPGYTALDLLGVASLGTGTVARVGALGKLAKEGGTAAEAARILRHGPAPGVRTFKVGDLEVTAPASKAASTRAAQKLLDVRRQRAAAKKPSGRAARVEAKKAGKALEETLRHEEALARAPANAMYAATKHLKAHEKWALRIQGEEAPIDARLAMLRDRVASSKGAERRRQAKRLELTRKAIPLFKSTSGKPELVSPGLRSAYDRMAEVAGGREKLGKELGLLTDAMIQGRKTSALRAASGYALEEPKLPEPPTPGQLSLVEPPKSDLPVASEQATYIPDVEQRIGRTGRVTSMGAQGTIGKPVSPIKYGYTGGAKRAGREPLDTTKAVAQANLAVTRFHRILNLRGKLEKAASPVPRFKDDIAIRLDKLGAHEKLPADVRAFVDDPSAFQPDDATRMFEKVRKSVLLAPENAAEFQRLHEAGKIGWVPKRLLGDLARPATPLSASVGKVPIAVADGINNAQRGAILYLKPAYAVPNILGNAALTLVQQGFAAPRNVTFAARMHWALGPELTARIDTLVGEGVSAALSGEGGGVGARATQFGAHVWSKGVDRPFRRASFLYEAKRAGFTTPKKLENLLTDPANHDALINVTIRANRELIDYGRLSSRERQVVRRVIFFYPWVKGSTLYAGHFLAEHPIKAAAAGQLGRYGHEQAQRDLGPVPSYLEGSFKAGGGLVNPTAASILQTPAQVAATVAGLVPGGPSMKAAMGANFLTPALELALAEAMRTNPQTGHQYKPGESIARDVLFRGLPQQQLYQGLRGRQTSKLYRDTPRSALLKFAVGGLAPRPYNAAYLRQLEAKERAGR